MTAHAMQGDRERFLGAGMNDYLEKPVMPRSLKQALIRWLPQEPPHREDASLRDEDGAAAAAGGGGKSAGEGTAGAGGPLSSP
jgi:hypothetical protein